MTHLTGTGAQIAFANDLLARVIPALTTAATLLAERGKNIGPGRRWSHAIAELEAQGITIYAGPASPHPSELPAMIPTLVNYLRHETDASALISYLRSYAPRDGSIEIGKMVGYMHPLIVSGQLEAK